MLEAGGSGQAGEEEEQEAGGPELSVQCHYAVCLSDLLLGLGLAVVTGAQSQWLLWGPLEAVVRAPTPLPSLISKKVVAPKRRER